MHLAEALLPRDEAIRLAADELRRVLARNGAYYERLPALRPDPERPLLEAVRAEDTCYWIPFGRGDQKAKPMIVRVNGVTRSVVVDAKM